MLILAEALFGKSGIDFRLKAVGAKDDWPEEDLRGAIDFRSFSE